MHIVIVDEELPYPADSGKRLRIFNLLRILSDKHKITLICHRNNQKPIEDAAIRYLRQIGIDSVLVNRNSISRFINKTRYATLIKVVTNFGSTFPLSVQWNRCFNLNRAISQYAKNNKVDLWQCEWAPYAESILVNKCSPFVMMAHDIQSRIWERHCNAENSSIKQAYIKMQWQRYLKYERNVFSNADLTITVSQEDSQIALNSLGARKVAVAENGVDVEYYRYSANISCNKGDDILFLGNLAWRPNIDAVKRLAEEIFPIVACKIPTARLIIVGKCPPKWIVEKYSKTGIISIFSNVDDVRPFLWKSKVMAVPLRFASGSRLKILEAFASGLPVVSTRVGAEGLRITAGTHFISAESNSEFAAALICCIKEPKTTYNIVSAGKEIVKQNYDWKFISKKLEDAWFSVCKGDRQYLG